MRRAKAVVSTTLAVLTIAGCGVVDHITSPVRSESVRYCAEMPDATGLYVGNPVTQMGYKVGSVAAVESGGDHVRVSFDLDPGRVYPSNVKAVTRSRSLLADRSLELVGNYSDGGTLEEGVCIPLENSFTPLTISEIAASTSDFVDQLAPPGQEKTIENALGGLAAALDGVGPDSRELVRNASAASADSDRLVSDFGTIISDMAPLSDQALRDWDKIESILVQMPGVLSAGTDLWNYSAPLTEGVGWLVATLFDIQRNYGSDIWPAVHGPLTEAIRLAATRSPDIDTLVSTIPSIAQVMRQQASAGDGFAVAYRPPMVEVDGIDPVLCGAINIVSTNACTTNEGGAQVRSDALLDAIMLRGDE